MDSYQIWRLIYPELCNSKTLANESGVHLYVHVGLYCVATSKLLRGLRYSVHVGSPFVSVSVTALTATHLVCMSKVRQ